jgi:GNAT superfamily N-acetyltransferase
VQNFKHIIKTEYKKTFRTSKVEGMFDFNIGKYIEKSWEIKLPIDEFNWEIGLITGASGTGKTQLAKKIFEKENYFISNKWDERSILDNFSEELEIKDIIDSLSHVGFSSPPKWILPYEHLSNGEKFRTDLARAILETDKDKILIFDEFTSLVDRNVAKISSYAVQKYIRNKKRKFVAVSCHSDIKEWLEADWIYDVSADIFYRGRLQRPDIKIEVIRTHNRIWEVFKGYHYLNHDINKASIIYTGFINEQPVGMVAILPFPHPYKKNTWKGHRTVVLPDYQGIGIGNHLSNYVGEILKKEGKKFISTTSHPAMIYYRTKSPKWKLTRQPSKLKKPGNLAKIQSNKNTSIRRYTCSFEYIG